LLKEGIFYIIYLIGDDHLRKSGLVEGAFAATIAIIFVKIIGVLYVVPFYKIVGEQGGALYGYAYSIYNLFLIVSAAGIPYAISKLTSEYETLGKVKEKVYMINLARKIIVSFSVISFLVVFFGSEIFAKIIIGNMTGGNTIHDVSMVIKSVSFALLIVPLLSIFRGYLQGHKYIIASSYSQVIEQIVRIVIIVVGSYIFVKVFNLPLYLAIAIAMLGAAIGAFISYLYLRFKSRKILKFEKTNLSDETKKSVRSKLLAYSIPFIVVNLSFSLYNTTDMILLIKGLNIIGYNATDIETISSIFTTWGNKLLSVIIAVATGLVISLIPNMVESYVKGKTNEVNNQYNKAMNILLIIILPLSLYMAIYAKEIWNIFYGPSFYGPIILTFAAVVAFLDSLYLIMGTILQNLNKFRLIYRTLFIGLGLNAILDIPLIILFDKIGIYPYYGAIAATVIGYSTSLYIIFKKLKIEDNISYSFVNIVRELSLSLAILIPLNIGFKYMVFNQITSRIQTLFALSIVSVISLIIFYIINKKLINDIFGDKFLKRFTRRK
jgi:O-antigen/teichoic acid export membrane protein